MLQSYRYEKKKSGQNSVGNDTELVGPSFKRQSVTSVLFKYFF